MKKLQQYINEGLLDDNFDVSYDAAPIELITLGGYTKDWENHIKAINSDLAELQLISKYNEILEAVHEFEAEEKRLKVKFSESWLPMAYKAKPIDFHEKY